MPITQKVAGKNVFVELSINMCLLLASYCCSANDHKHGGLEQMTAAQQLKECLHFLKVLEV